MIQVLWLIGSNSSGKTTQSKLIHERLNSTLLGKIIWDEMFINSKGEEVKTFYTLFPHSSHVGALRDNQCTGTDSLQTKDQIEFAYLRLLQKRLPLIIIDGIMATATWEEMIHQARSWMDIKTTIVLLDFPTVEDNLRRVMQRRAIKAGIATDEVELGDKTILNVSSKFSGFKSMFDKTKNKFNQNLRIDATLEVDEINQLIIKNLKP